MNFIMNEKSDRYWWNICLKEFQISTIFDDSVIWFRLTTSHACVTLSRHVFFHYKTISQNLRRLQRPAPSHWIELPTTVLIDWLVISVSFDDFIDRLIDRLIVELSTLALHFLIFLHLFPAVVFLSWHCVHSMKMLDTSKTQEKPSTQSVSDEQDRTFKGAFKTFKLMKGDILQAIKQSGLVVVDSGDSESWSKLDCWAVRPDHDKNEAGNLDLSEEFGLLPVEQWEAKTVPSCPGGVILRNPFTKDGERRWIEHSLLDYPVREDFPSNLDRHWEYSETRSQLSWWPTPLDMVEQSERPKKKRKHGRNVIEDKK